MNDSDEERETWSQRYPVDEREKIIEQYLQRAFYTYTHDCQGEEYSIATECFEIFANIADATRFKGKLGEMLDEIRKASDVRNNNKTTFKFRCIDFELKVYYQCDTWDGSEMESIIWRDQCQKREERERRKQEKIDFLRNGYPPNFSSGTMSIKTRRC